MRCLKRMRYHFDVVREETNYFYSPRDIDDMIAFGAKENDKIASFYRRLDQVRSRKTQAKSILIKQRTLSPIKKIDGPLLHGRKMKKSTHIPVKSEV